MDSVEKALRETGTIRAFAAVSLPRSLYTSDALMIARKQLYSLLEGEFGVKAEWEDAGYHITLRFFGDVTYEQIHKIQHSLLVTSSPMQNRFNLSLGHYGTFPDKSVRNIIYLGLRGEVEGLRVAAWRADEAARYSGLPPADFAFNPHITLCKIPYLGPGESEKLRESLYDLPELLSLQWTVPYIALMYSYRAKDMLGNSHIEYRQLSRSSLK